MMSPPPESGKVKTAAASANTNVFPESAAVKVSLPVTDYTTEITALPAKVILVTLVMF